MGVNKYSYMYIYCKSLFLGVPIIYENKSSTPTFLAYTFTVKIWTMKILDMLIVSN